MWTRAFGVVAITLLSGCARAVPSGAMVAGESPGSAPASETQVSDTPPAEGSPEWFRKMDQSIAEITDLVKSMPDGNEKAARLFELGELYFQKSRSLRTTDAAHADLVLNKSVSIYEFALKKYPGNSHAPRALYFLSEGYEQLGKKSQAVATRTTLRTRYPASEFIEQLPKDE